MKKLHKSPKELRDALAMKPEERRRKRNFYPRGSAGDFGWTAYLRRERRMRQAVRRAHRVPLSD